MEQCLTLLLQSIYFTYGNHIASFSTPNDSTFHCFSKLYFGTIIPLIFFPQLQFPLFPLCPTHLFGNPIFTFFFKKAKERAHFVSAPHLNMNSKRHEAEPYFGKNKTIYGNLVSPFWQSFISK